MNVFDKIGIEAASAMGVSPLAAGITRILTSAFKYKATLSDSPQDNYDHMVKYNTKKLKPAIEKIVNDQLNLNINLIVDDRTNDFGPFACAPKIGDKDGIASFFRFNRPTKASLKKHDVGELVAELQNIIDLDSGALKSQTVKFKGSKELLSIDLYFSTKLGFFSREFHGYGDDEYIPTELASILVHELGHMITLLQESGRQAEIHYRTLDLKESLLKLPVKERIEAGVKISKVMRSNDSIRANKMLYDTVSESEQVMLKLKAGTSDKSYIGDATRSVGIMAISGLTLLLAPLHYLFMDRRATTMSMIPAYIKHDQHADIDELFSDNFVVNHGLGSELAVALDKMVNNNIRASFGVEKKHRLASYLTLSIMIPLVNDMSATPDIIGGRFQNMEKEVLKILRNDKLNKTQRTHYESEYVKLRAVVVSRNPGSLSKLRSLVMKIGAKLTGKWYGTRFDTKFKDDLERLDRIMNSELAFAYSKLKSIMDS